MWECFYYSYFHTWYAQYQWVYDAIQNLVKWGVISKTLKNFNLCWCYSDDEINVKFILVGEKLQWFQSHLDPSKIEYTKKEAGELIEK